jgi:FkbM family methyltransferase
MSTIKRIPWNGKEWAWPSDDTDLIKVIDDVAGLDVALKHVKERRTAVQAGAACGIWGWHLAQEFEHVFLFEPHPVNFMCAAINLHDVDNVTLIRGALGSGQRWARIEQGEKRNAGTYYTVSGPTGTTRVFALDHVVSADLDLLCLDVEGSEIDALNGASENIYYSRPVLMVEDKRLPHSAALHRTPGDLQGWAQRRGYKQVDKWRRDVIFASGV